MYASFFNHKNTMDIVDRRIVVFGFTVLFPLFIISLVSIVVGGIHSDTTCDIGNIVRLWKWMIVNSIINQFIIIFVTISSTAYAITSYRRNINSNRLDTLCRIISYSTYICISLSVIWSMVGVIAVNSTQGKICYNDDQTLWQTTKISLISQFIAASIVITIGCCNRIPA